MSESQAKMQEEWLKALQWSLEDISDEKKGKIQKTGEVYRKHR